MPEEERSIVTDDEGYYDFSDLMPGTYLVCEQIPEGWVQTHPRLAALALLEDTETDELPEEWCYSVYITESGQHISEVDFGNYLDTQPVVSITTNPGDSTILSSITLTANILLDSGNEPVTITGWEQVGGDAFPGCSGTDSSVVTPSTPGTYTCKVTVTDLDGDTASATKTVVVNPEIIVDNLPTVLLIANSPAIGGTGVVYVTANTSFTITASLYSMGDPNYNYTFGGVCSGSIVGSPAATFVSNTLSLPVGTYTCSVTVADNDGDVAISSVPIVVSGVLGVGANIEETQEEEEQTEENNEPNVAGASTCETTYKLSGYVYDDKNGNEIIDEGETGLGNVEVTITANGFSETVFTNAEGYWKLDVCPGDYEVSVRNTDLPAGYSVSTEDEKQVDTSVNNQDVEGVNISATSSVPAFPWWIILLVLLAAMGGGGYYLYRRQNGELQMK